MNNENKLIIGLAILIVLLVAIIAIKNNIKKPNVFLENVKSIYTSALSEYDNEEKLYSNIYKEDKSLNNVSNDLSYMVKFNDNGQIVYLVVSNGKERFQLGSIYENIPIKKEDITEDKIVSDVSTSIKDEFQKNYVIVDEGSNQKYKIRGYYIEENDNITIALGQKSSGSYKMSVNSVYGKEGEYTVVVKVDEPQGDVQIQVISYPYITINLRGVKIINLIVKDTNGNTFERITPNKIDDTLEEEKIRTIIIEKKEVSDEELNKLDKDSDGKITTNDIDVIKDTNTVSPTLVICSKGEYKKDNVCIPCPENTYGVDGKKCTSCPINTCSSEGSTSKSDCTRCEVLSDPIKPPLVYE